MVNNDDKQPEEVKIGESVLSEADRRGHGCATRRSALGAAAGALIGSFGGPVGATIGAGIGAVLGYNNGKEIDDENNRNSH
jgi:uncharacterized membrane protein